LSAGVTDLLGRRRTMNASIIKVEMD